MTAPKKHFRVLLVFLLFLQYGLIDVRKLMHVMTENAQMHQWWFPLELGCIEQRRQFYQY